MEDGHHFQAVYKTVPLQRTFPDGGGRHPPNAERQLKELERDGLVSRTVESSRPVSVVYALTENAKGLLPLLDLVSKWVREYRLLVQRRDVQSGS